MPEIIEATWNGEPTFLIGKKDLDGNVVNAVWKNIDGKLAWISRPELGWHSQNRKEVEDVFNRFFNKGDEDLKNA